MIMMGYRNVVRGLISRMLAHCLRERVQGTQ